MAGFISRKGSPPLWRFGPSLCTARAVSLATSRVGKPPGIPRRNHSWRLDQPRLLVLEVQTPIRPVVLEVQPAPARVAGPLHPLAPRSGAKRGDGWGEGPCWPDPSSRPSQPRALRVPHAPHLPPAASPRPRPADRGEGARLHFKCNAWIARAPSRCSITPSMAGWSQAHSAAMARLGFPQSTPWPSTSARSGMSVHRQRKRPERSPGRSAGALTKQDLAHYYGKISCSLMMSSPNCKVCTLSVASRTSSGNSSRHSLSWWSAGRVRWARPPCFGMFSPTSTTWPLIPASTWRTRAPSRTSF